VYSERARSKKILTGVNRINRIGKPPVWGLQKTEVSAPSFKKGGHLPSIGEFF
jgi:hypothetical protein